MKKPWAAVLAALGLIATLAGGAGIVLIGRDNVIDSPASEIALGDAKAVISTPGLLAFTNVTMTVSASNSAGPIFIGRGHPVDVTSFLGGAPTATITQVGTDGVTTTPAPGRADVSIPDPTRQSFWTQKVSGSGTQTLTMPLNGTPTEYVILPLGKAGTVTMSSGVQIAHGFALCVGALILGLLLLAYAITRWRNGPGRTPPATDTSTPSPSTGSTALPTTAPTTAPTSARRSAETPRTRSASPHVGRTRLIGLIGAGLLLPAVAGCSALPSKADPWKTSTVTRVAMSPVEATAAMKDYDIRNNAVIASTHKTHNISEWTKVDTGTVLAEDQYDTKVDEATGEGDGKPFTHTVKQVYSPAFSSYPMYALTAQSTSSDPTKTSLVAMRRQSVTASWMMQSSALLEAALPPPAAGGALDAQQRQAVLKAAAAVQEKFNSGKGEITLPTKVNNFLTQWRVKKDFLSSATVNATYFNPEASDQLGPVGSIQAARTTTGMVALVNFRVRADYVAKDGYLVSFPDTAFAKVIGQPGPREALRFRTALTLALTLDAQGKPTVVGSTMNYLL